MYITPPPFRHTDRGPGGRGWAEFGRGRAGFAHPVLFLAVDADALDEERGADLELFGEVRGDHVHDHHVRSPVHHDLSAGAFIGSAADK